MKGVEDISAPFIILNCLKLYKNGYIIIKKISGGNAL